MTTILYQGRRAEVAEAVTEGDDLWLPVGELAGATGWELKPEGACLGDLCVPIPAGREAEFMRDEGDRFNVAALARLLDEPAARDEEGTVWAFGPSADARVEQLASLEAPDFSLPDLDGRMHSLSEFRGKKVLLVSWASW